MTAQTKKSIELSDLLGLRFQCKKCGASLTLPLIDEVDARKLRLCPHCERPWLAAGGTTVEASIPELVKALKQLSVHLSGGSGFPVGCDLALEIKEEKPPITQGDK